MSDRQKTAKVLPRWFVRTAWVCVSRALSRKRRPFRPPAAESARWQRFAGSSMTGRRSGQERGVILAYLEDGPNIFTLAMNGWGDGEPAGG